MNLAVNRADRWVVSGLDCGDPANALVRTSEYHRLYLLSSEIVAHHAITPRMDRYLTLG